MGSTVLEHDLVPNDPSSKPLNLAGYLCAFAQQRLWTEIPNLPLDESALVCGRCQSCLISRLTLNTGLSPISKRLSHKWNSISLDCLRNLPASIIFLLKAHTPAQNQCCHCKISADLGSFTKISYQIRWCILYLDSNFWVMLSSNCGCIFSTQDSMKSMRLFCSAVFAFISCVQRIAWTVKSVACTVLIWNYDCAFPITFYVNSFSKEIKNTSIRTKCSLYVTMSLPNKAFVKMYVFMGQIFSWAKVLKAKPSVRNKLCTYGNPKAINCHPYTEKKARENQDLLKYEVEFL